jgi:hypothetical protein
MHMVNVGQKVTADQVATTLRGAGYAVTTGKSGDDLVVKKGAVKTAKVSVIPDGGSTEFQVRGASWLISLRMMNERGIAKDVSELLESDTFSQ